MWTLEAAFSLAQKDSRVVADPWGGTYLFEFNMANDGELDAEQTPMQRIMEKVGTKKLAKVIREQAHGKSVNKESAELVEEGNESFWAAMQIEIADTLESGELSLKDLGLNQEHQRESRRVKARKLIAGCSTKDGRALSDEEIDALLKLPMPIPASKDEALIMARAARWPDEQLAELEAGSFETPYGAGKRHGDALVDWIIETFDSMSIVSILALGAAAKNSEAPSEAN